MEEIKNNFIKLLQIVQKEFNNLNNDEIISLLKGEAKLEIIIKSKSKRKNIKSNIDFDKIETELRVLKSREQGIELLNKYFTSKEQLEKFAKILDLPILKGDKIELIKKKIVEATIGYKLRSNSIQNK